MQSNNTLKLILPSYSGYEKTAMRIVSNYAALSGFPHEQCDDIRTIVCEGFLNAIEHSPLSGDPVRLSCRLDMDTLEIEITDSGIQPLNLFLVPDNINLRERRKLENGSGDFRGWGLYLIKKLCSYFESNVIAGHHTLTIGINKNRKSS